MIALVDVVGGCDVGGVVAGVDAGGVGTEVDVGSAVEGTGADEVGVETGVEVDVVVLLQLLNTGIRTRMITNERRNTFFIITSCYLFKYHALFAYTLGNQFLSSSGLTTLLDIDSILRIVYKNIVSVLYRTSYVKSTYKLIDRFSGFICFGFNLLD